ncbi:type IV pili methyl-accepting chemotaxis transducer N-terminal domain-containing protein [Candidatus Terasakiella magnetica]|nr:type IV pili methyl-accepting chemotaxis transducer N-terminal domain-containing protein [Candidatus Terasakiella magnetica]
MYFLRQMSVTAAVFLFALSIVQDTHANASLENQKIEILNKLKMLTQSVATSACYIGSFYEADRYSGKLSQSIDTFNANLDKLINGEEITDFPKEDDPKILAQLKKLDTNWKLLQFASDILLRTSKLPGLDVDIIAEFNMPTLEQADRAISAMEQQYTSTKSDQANIRTLQLIGDQVVLVQKITKEFCLISYQYASVKDRQRLRDAVRLFDQNLMDLTKGNSAENILSAPTKGIVKTLGRVSDNWEDPREILLKIADGKHATYDDFDEITYMNKKLVKYNKIAQSQFLRYFQSQSGE